MAGNFTKNWSKEADNSFVQRLEDKVHRVPLKERIAHANYRLKILQDKLSQACARMQRHDQELFEKCVAAELAKDRSRAAMYANECAEVRKMAKILLASELAIEQVMLRLETVEEFGDVVVEMAPVAGVVHAIRGKLSGIVPEVSYELGSVGEVLNGMLVEAGETTGTTWDVGTSSEESRRILSEAGSVADQRIKERFPDLPSGYRAPERESYFSH